MKKEIWKYPLNEKIPIPEGAEILCVQTQNEYPMLWCLVDPLENSENRYFETFGTGHPINYDMGISRKYIGTYQQSDGTLIWHVFERIL